MTSSRPATEGSSSHPTTTQAVTTPLLPGLPFASLVPAPTAAVAGDWLPEAHTADHGETPPLVDGEIPPVANGETPPHVELASVTHAEALHALISDDDIDYDDSTTDVVSTDSFPLSQLVPVADTPIDSDNVSDEDGWMPPVTREDSVPSSVGDASLLPAESALADGGEESEGTTTESSMPALVHAENSDDDFSFDLNHREVPAGADEECVLGMACASCGTPVVAASELLPEQTGRLERKVYAYELDFLDEENAWCYSATNESDDRFDVARFGGDARFRVTPPAPSASRSLLLIARAALLCPAALAP